MLAAARTSTGLIFAWALAMVLSVLAAIPMLALGPAQPGQGAIGHRMALVRRFGKLSLQHHVLNLSISSVSYIIPLAATLLISPQQVAYFSAAYLFTATILILPYLLAVSLFAERSGDAGLLHRHVRRTFPLGLVLAGAIVLVVEIAAPYALRIFGPAYAVNGATALRLMVLVGPAYVVKDHYVSICRAQRLMTHASKITAIGTMAEVTGAAVGGVGVGPHWDLRRLGCLGVVRSSRTTTERAASLSSSPSGTDRQGNKHGLAETRVRQETGPPLSGQRRAPRFALLPLTQ